jgi:hypothetical protein
VAVACVGGLMRSSACTSLAPSVARDGSHIVAKCLLMFLGFGRNTRYSENAPFRETQAGSLLHVDHRRIGRRRLLADSACPGRAIDPHEIRADHAAFSGSVRHFCQGIPDRFLDAFDTSTCGGHTFGSGMAPPRPRTAQHEPSSTHADWQT